MQIDEITKGIDKDGEVVLKTRNGDLPIKFKFYPNIWTPELEEASREERIKAQGTDILVIMTTPVLAWIDIQDKDGVDLDVDNEDMEIARKAVAKIPNPVLNAILTFINEDADPGKKQSSRSGGSFAGSKRETSHSGT